MIIGNFTYDFDKDTYAGEIATLTLQRDGVRFLPTEKAGEREPDYRIVQDLRGAAIELGAAWKRSSGRGRDYLSVVLDDPALPSPLSAALFLSEGDERATLVWQRQNKKPPVAEVKTATTRARRSSANGAPRPS